MNAPLSFFTGMRCGDVMRTEDEETMLNALGHPMLEGASVKITAIEQAQPDPRRPPVEIATLNIRRLQPNGSRNVYDVKQPSERLETDFDAVIREAIPGVRFDNRNDQLFTAILVLSFESQAHRMPIRTTHAWIAPEGVFWKGRWGGSPCEIVSVTRDQSTGILRYRLRAPRRDGTGFDYASTDWNGLNDGSFGRQFGDQFKIGDPVILSMALRALFEGLSETDRKKLLEDEYQQTLREMESNLRERFPVNKRR